jgi:hypothetical protein
MKALPHGRGSVAQLNRARTSLCENYGHPLPSVTAQYRRSSKITALLSRDQRERSTRMVFTHTRKRADFGDTNASA